MKSFLMVSAAIALISPLTISFRWSVNWDAPMKRKIVGVAAAEQNQLDLLMQQREG
jgi:hypothetical protein